MPGRIGPPYGRLSRARGVGDDSCKRPTPTPPVNLRRTWVPFLRRPEPRRQARPQPRARARPRHRGRRARRGALGRSGRQERRRRGRGRRDAPRPRHRPDGRPRRDRRGREGRGADALQRRADRRRQPAGGRHRRRPARGHQPLRTGHAVRARGDRARRARHDVRPGPCVYMEKIAGGAEIADLLDLDRPLPETSKPSPSARASGRRRDRGHARPPAPRGGDEGSARRAPASASSPTATSPPRCSRSATPPVDLLWGIGGTPEGVISAAAIKSIGGQLLGRLWPRDDDERQAALDAGYDLDRVLDADRPAPATTSSSPPPASPTATCSRASATAARRHHRVARDALALGHRPHGQRPPRPGEAARDHRRALRLIAPLLRLA